MTGQLPRTGDPAPVPADVAVPSPTDIGLIVVALCAVSTSGPLIAACAVPALAIAFWRNVMALGVLVPWSLARRSTRRELRATLGRRGGLAVAAGVLLAAHFATWVPSLRYTSVASSTALVATQPIWAALIARAQGRRIPRAAWVGIAVAVLGAALLTGLDVTLSARALLGDALATVGGFFAAAYVTAGAAVRRTTSTTVYTTVCYSIAGVLLLVLCLVGRQSLAGYHGADWLRLLALTAGAQLLGHSVFSVVLRTTSATVVSLSILFEAPGAATIAFFVLHQRPHAWAIPAVLLLLAGVAIVIRSSRTEPAVLAE